MALSSIGQVAKRFGVRPSTIRYYERVGLLPEPHRIGGQRRYAPDVEERLAAVQVAQRAGFTIAEIKRLLYGYPRSAKPSERWQSLAKRKLPEVEALIGRATRMRELLLAGIDCDCSSLGDCELMGTVG